METGIIIALCISLGTITYQDFKFRSVSWVLLPVIFILFSVLTYLRSDVLQTIKNVIINTAFFSLQLSIVMVYFSKRYKGIKNFTNNVMGWGDILFYIAVTPLFILPVFLIFMIASTIIILISYPVLKRVEFFNFKFNNIPLAGFASIFLNLIMIFQLFFPSQYHKVNFILPGAF